MSVFNYITCSSVFLNTLTLCLNPNLIFFLSLQMDLSLINFNEEMSTIWNDRATDLKKVRIYYILNHYRVSDKAHNILHILPKRNFFCFHFLLYLLVTSRRSCAAYALNTFTSQYLCFIIACICIFLIYKRTFIFAKL